MRMTKSRCLFSHTGYGIKFCTESSVCKRGVGFVASLRNKPTNGDKTVATILLEF